jgi:hypothetical protein
MCTDSTDHTVFRAFGNVIPGDKETYVEDLSNIWIRDALMIALIKTYIFRVLLEQVSHPLSYPFQVLFKVAVSDGSLGIDKGSPSESTCQNNAILLAFAS